MHPLHFSSILTLQSSDHLGEQVPTLALSFSFLVPAVAASGPESYLRGYNVTNCATADADGLLTSTMNPLPQNQCVAICTFLNFKDTIGSDCSANQSPAVIACVSSDCTGPGQTAGTLPYSPVFGSCVEIFVGDDLSKGIVGGLDIYANGVGL